jgi:hypothetical protein
MALWVCSGCSTRYAPGSPACPHCGGAEHIEEGAAASQGPLLPSVHVCCPTNGCRAYGVVRRVGLPLVAPGVLAQPACRCSVCGAVMDIVGGWQPPAAVEDTLAKITRHGGATNAAADREREGAGRPPASGEREHQLAAPGEGVEVPADGTRSAEVADVGTWSPDVADHSTGGEESSPGNSSSTSAEKQPSSSGKTKPARRRPARTTASRSSKGRAAGSAAPSTDGPGEADEAS